jgi:hypothetical protein
LVYLVSFQHSSLNTYLPSVNSFFPRACTTLIQRGV